MSENRSLTLAMGEPASYRIVVLGAVDSSWQGCLGCLEIRVTKSECGELQTHLEGQVRDQAELSGVLNSLYDLHLPLVRVERLAIG